MLETYLDEKVHLSSKIWLSEVEKPRIFHDFPANSLCKLHREFEQNQGFSSNFQVRGPLSPSSNNIFD